MSTSVTAIVALLPSSHAASSSRVELTQGQSREGVRPAERGRGARQAGRAGRPARGSSPPRSGARAPWRAGAGRRSRSPSAARLQALQAAGAVQASSWGQSWEGLIPKRPASAAIERRDLRARRVKRRDRERPHGPRDGRVAARRRVVGPALQPGRRREQLLISCRPGAAGDRVGEEVATLSAALAVVAATAPGPRARARRGQPGGLRGGPGPSRRRPRAAARPSLDRGVAAEAGAALEVETGEKAGDRGAPRSGSRRRRARSPPRRRRGARRRPSGRGRRRPTRRCGSR